MNRNNDQPSTVPSRTLHGYGGAREQVDDQTVEAVQHMLKTHTPLECSRAHSVSLRLVRRIQSGDRKTKAQREAIEQANNVRCAKCRSYLNDEGICVMCVARRARESNLAAERLRKQKDS